MLNLARIINEHVQKLVPYQSARRIGGHGHTFLNANESPKSERYLLNSTKLNRYPECQPEELLEGYAGYAGTTRDRVLCCRGSDEAIGLIVRTFVGPEEAVLIAPPTYGMYEVAARTNNVQVVKARRNEDFSLSFDLLKEAIDHSSVKVKVVFIDSPANPLGQVFAEAELRALLEAYPQLLVVVDEAYVEFAGIEEHSRITLLPEYDNLIITRTMSKAFALAGLRLGYALGHPEVLKALLKVIDPYPISEPVAQIGAQALSSTGVSLTKERVQKCVELRERLRGELEKLKCVREVFPSQANFLLIRFGDGPAVFKALAERGIIVRSFVDKPGLDNCLRISIGSPEELDETMRTLTALDGTL
ncbi:MAG: histidinol-phosphate transaminase [Succinivibrio sp.]|nr:histidinol-phosphate transaminase [Succinivibrio sp.]